MIKIKLLALGFLLGLLTVTANASILQLTCVGAQTHQDCAQQIQNALSKVGCNIDSNQSRCDHFVKPDPQNPNGPNIPIEGFFCEVLSNNCSQPEQMLFGGDRCYSDSIKVKISKSDGVHNGYSYGLLGSYSRHICILK